MVRKEDQEDGTQETCKEGYKEKQEVQVGQKEDCQCSNICALAVFLTD